MLQFYKRDGGQILIVYVTGKLTKEDYSQFQPEVERLIETHGTIRVLCHMHDFHGWELGALWEDVKFDVQHFADIERLALVGHTRWQSAMATFCKPFTTAEVRYFKEHQIVDAEQWIEADRPASRPTEPVHAAVAEHDVVHEASEESFPASDSPAY